jgi:uncharacterized protein (DUF58 family)
VTGRRVSPRLLAYLVVAAALLTAGVLTGRGPLLALGAPVGFAVVMAVALGAATTQGRVRLVDPTDREVAEGAEVAIAVEVHGPRRAVVDVALALPPSVAALDGARPRRLRLGRDGSAVDLVRLQVDRWGRHQLGLGVVRSRDPLGLVSQEAVLADQVTVRVRPGVERVRTPVRPSRLRLATGAHPARVVGPGIEFAGLRAYQAGDRPRDLSWRATARGDELVVTERHPERSADVVLFVDSFAAEGLDQTVRAAMTVAGHQLAERDRVGLVVFGGSMRLLRPAAGRRQLRALADALIDIRPVFSWADKEIRAIPPRMLPAGAAIVAISPLVDERTVGAIGDLRRRRLDIRVIEVSPSRWTPEPSSAMDRLAWRLWEMQRQARRDRFAALGVPVVQWREGLDVELLLAQFARQGGRARRWVA